MASTTVSRTSVSCVDMGLTRLVLGLADTPGLGVSPLGDADDPYPKPGGGLVMCRGVRMLIALTVLGHPLLELRIGRGAAATPDDGHEPQHIEDHTGYTMGFVPTLTAPAELDMPDRT